MIRSTFLFLATLGLQISFLTYYVSYCKANQSESSASPSRGKRFLWITHDRRLIFPPGTILDLKPTLQVPFLRKEEPPDGIHSDIQISWFFYIIFDELGLTHTTHPFPPFYPFGTLFGPSKRSLSDKDAFLKDSEHSPDTGTSRKYKKQDHMLCLPSADSFPGGERAFIYPKLEKLLHSFGWEGRPCLLRIVCETHEYPLKYGYGLLGELFTLFFTASQSPFAKSHLPSYLEAEDVGRTGNCSRYFPKCDKSIFKWEDRKIREHNKFDENLNPGKENRNWNDNFIRM